MTRGKRQESGPGTRRCIATGKPVDPAGMIRFVVSPEDEIVPDILGKLPGRGIWVSAQAEALERAERRNLFPKAAGRKVRVAPGFRGRVESSLVKRIVELISLARKSGGAVAGFERAKAALETGKAGVLIQASDGSPRQLGKLRPGEKGEGVSCLSAEELGRAFGRESATHVALHNGNLASLVIREAARLSALRQSPESPGGAAKPERKRVSI